MEKLQENWLTDGVLDQEYKTYLFLAWLQKAKREFTDARLYPALSRLIEEHRRLDALRKGKADFSLKIRRDVKEIDLRKMRLVYKELEEHPELNEYLNSLIEFALPRLESMLREGKSLYDLVDEHLQLTPVGLVPMYRKEGYLFLYDEPRKDVYLFRYVVSLLELADEHFHSLQTALIDQRRKSLGQTFEQLKVELIKRFTDLPNPATYLVRCNLAFPLHETLLPIARRRLMLELKSA